jgi:hypothetical protein
MLEASTPEHQPGDDQRDEEGRSVPLLVAEDHAVDGVADHAQRIHRAEAVESWR